MDGDEVTQWLGRVAQGDAEAALKIWDRYCEQRFTLARRKLGDFPPRAADEEDMAFSAFNSFCEAAAAGRFPQLADRDDLWRLLVSITVRKVIAQLRRDRRQKCGGGAIRGESVFMAAGSDEDLGGIDQVLGRSPTPAMAAVVSEECGRLLDLLDDETLQTIALWKFKGYTNEEIAAKLDCAVTTVECKLARIRKVWSGAVLD